MGLLRPATPLALILFVAFVLLLLATLSTPIIPAIPLGSWEGVHLGVFGWCNAAGTCSGFQIGYGTGKSQTPMHAVETTHAQRTAHQQCTETWW